MNADARSLRERLFIAMQHLLDPGSVHLAKVDTTIERSIREQLTAVDGRVR